MNPLRFSKILIVDDSSFFRSNIKKILKEAKIDSIYYEAKNGAEGISQYIAKKPHLVIMDIVMPKVDGVKATQAITKYNPNAKIIVISTKENQAIINAVIKVGNAKDYIIKPFNSGSVVMAVSKQLVPSRLKRTKQNSNLTEINNSIIENSYSQIHKQEMRISLLN